MKKHLLSVLLLAVTIVAVIAGLMIMSKNNPLGDAAERGIGKELYIVVEKGEVADYNYFMDGSLSVWNQTGREQMMEYMRENNLVLAEGSYVMNQTTTFEEALDIFKLKPKED